MSADIPVTQAQVQFVLHFVQSIAAKIIATGQEHAPTLLFFSRANDGSATMGLTHNIMLQFCDSDDKNVAAALIRAALSERLADAVVLVTEAWVVKVKKGPSADKVIAEAVKGKLHKHPARIESLLVNIYTRSGQVVVTNEITGKGKSRRMEISTLPDDILDDFKGRFSIHD